MGNIFLSKDFLSFSTYLVFCVNYSYIREGKTPTCIEKQLCKKLIRTMVDKGLVGDSLLFIAITLPVIALFGIFLIAVIIWVCRDFLCTENWRTGQTITTLFLRAQEIHTGEPIINSAVTSSNKTN